MTNSSDYEPTRHKETIISASQVFREVWEEERRKNLPQAVEEEEEAGPDSEVHIRRLSPAKRKEVKEMGTDYDPPGYL
jgi:hypothetical protein